MKVSFIASGDSFITRHVADCGYPGFDEIRDLIKSHDVSFANLEMTFHRQEGYPAATSGGTWAMTDPTMLDDMDLIFLIQRTTTLATLDKEVLVLRSNTSMKGRCVSQEPATLFRRPLEPVI